MADKVTTLDEIIASRPTADFAKMDATTDEDIARQIAQDPDTAPEFDTLRALSAVQRVRQQLAMTQAQFSAWLNIPVGTVRNWEQKRRIPDPVVLTLLKIIEREPDAVRRALEAA